MGLDAEDSVSSGLWACCPTSMLEFNAAVAAGSDSGPVIVSLPAWGSKLVVIRGDGAGIPGC